MMLSEMRLSVRHPGAGVTQHQSGQKYSMHLLSHKGAGGPGYFIHVSGKTAAVTPAITSAR